MAVNKKRTRRNFSSEKIHFRKNVQLELSQENYEMFEEESNAGEFLSDLLEEYYDENIVKVQIDENIREAYNNDIYKEFRIKMLLLDFYLNGNIQLNVENKTSPLKIKSDLKITKEKGIENSNVLEYKEENSEETSDANDKEVIVDKISKYEQNQNIYSDKENMVSEASSIKSKKEHTVKTSSQKNNKNGELTSGSLDMILPKNTKNLI